VNFIITTITTTISSIIVIHFIALSRFQTQNREQRCTAKVSKNDYTVWLKMTLKQQPVEICFELTRVPR